jgi:hypothetical protein
VKYFKYLDRMITNDARLTREIKSRTVMAKQDEGSFHKQTGLKFKEETSEVLHLECWNLDSSKSRSKISGKLWNVVLEMDRRDQLNPSREKLKRDIT